MNRILALALLLILVWPLPSRAEWRKDGKLAPDNDWRKTAGAFAAMMFITDNPQKVYEAWHRPPAADYTPPARNVESITRDGTVAAIVVFDGCKPDKAGTCNLDADYRLILPNGKLYIERKGLEVSRGDTPRPLGVLRIARGAFGLRFEPKDPLGVYMIEATVYDRNAGVQVKLKRPVELRPSR
jgi:hypothetical protein